MAVQTRVTSQKFFAQLNNGDTFALNTSDFAAHLKGGVLENIKAVFEVEVDWTTKIENFQMLYDVGANTIRLTSAGVDWMNDGFSIGDPIKISTTSLPRRITGTVTSITGSEIIIDTVVFVSGGALPAGSTGFSGDDTYVTGLSDLTALKYKFGLIENLEPFNTLSKLTNSDQVYLFTGINHAAPGTFTSGVSLGNNKAWVTGSMRVAFDSLVTDRDFKEPEATTQKFIVEHIFIINPIFRDGEIDSLKGIDISPLTIFNGNKSLKYVFETEFRTVINNPNTSKIAEYDTQQGSVGYLGESYNGYANVYTVQNLVYLNVTDAIAATKIDAGKVMQVNFTIKSSSGSINVNTPLVVGHTSIINSLSYVASLSEYQPLWLHESIRNTAGAVFVDGTIIKGFTCTRIDANTLDVQFTTQFTSSQQTQITNGQDYLLWFNFMDNLLTVDTGDKVVDRIDVNLYEKSSDIEGLYQVDTLDQYPHPESFILGSTDGYTQGKMFVEDGQMLDARFKVKDTFTDPDTGLTHGVDLVGLKFKIVAFNTADNTWFDLRELNIDLSSQVVVGNIQNINLNSTRGYILTDTDIFNSLVLTTDTNAGGFQFYNMQIGYKIPWQDWLVLIGADTIFYDPTKENDGLNNNSSNYSFTNNHVIRFLIDAVIETNGIETNYIDTSGNFMAYNYDTDDISPDAFTCLIETHDSMGVALASNIIDQSFTELRATFTPDVPPVFTQSVDFTEVSTLWHRFAHGNQLTGAQPRIGTWANQQASATDTFSDGVSNFLKSDASLYTSLPTSILTNQNCNAFYGAFSLIQYEFYNVVGEMFSTDADNDVLILTLAFMTDDLGVEHTISLCVTTGGVLLDINPSYVPGGTTISTMFFDTSGTTPASWALVYDFGKDGAKQLLSTNTTKAGFLWDDVLVGDFNFDVTRVANDLTIDCNWTIDGSLFSSILNFDMASDTDTEKFLGQQHIAFGFMSQTSGGFKNVILESPNADFYGILRMENVNSPSDFGISELSSLIEAPQNSQLKQLTGLVRKASLSWDGVNFILQGQVDTSTTSIGEDYKFSAEIRSKNLEL